MTSWLFILGVVLFLIGLAVSIGLHELGHLIPAKIFKVPVAKYFIGFGPKIFGKKIGETEYGIKAIPLGGFISIGGMYPPKDPDVDPALELATGSSLAGADADANGSSVVVRKRGFFGRTIDDARAANIESMNGFAPERAFYRLPAWKRIIVMFGGPFMNLILAFVLFAIVFCGIGTYTQTTSIQSVAACIPASSVSTACTPTSQSSPAKTAGFLAGDKLVSVNGTTTDSWASLTSIIRSSAGKTLTVVVLRNGVTQTLHVTPVAAKEYVYDSSNNPVKNADGTVKTTTVGVIGITPSSAMVPQPITAVFPAMGQTVTGTVAMIGNLPGEIFGVGQAAFGGATRSVNSPVSVIGIGRVAGQIASTNQIPEISKVATLLSLLASLNIALFVFNLIPLLPLDGGHIASALYDAIRRGIAKLRRKADPGPFDASVLVPVTVVVMTILIAMSALIIYADIVKPVNLFG